MIKLYQSKEAFFQASSLSRTDTGAIRASVAAIILKVKREKDAALKHYTELYDKVILVSVAVSVRQIREAEESLPPDLRAMFEEAIERVRAFHRKQLPKSWLEETADGSRFGLRFTAIENVGLYVPGGTAAYPSTVIMTSVPAQLAGCKRVALASPPGEDGLVNSLVLGVASLLGIEEVYVVGGVQAVAALAYGTQSVKRVDKIVGPGNMYVNEAKRQVFGDVGIDSLAGPTELVVLADDSANPAWVAQDMLAQAEHDVETRVICVTTSRDFADTLIQELQRLVRQGGRVETLQQALSRGGAVITVEDLFEGTEVINTIAPEHLQIMTAAPAEILPKIQNAGAIFLGDWSPAVVGDYCAGPNHVLPTDGSARFSSPLGVMDFMKFSSVFHYSEQAFRNAAPTTSLFADIEKLPNHKKAIDCRYEQNSCSNKA